MRAPDLGPITWRKSSYSSGNNNCIEIAELRSLNAVWRKSSHSSGNPQQCVEVGETRDARGVRDSKLGEASPILAFDRSTWAAFLTNLKSGHFDR